MGQEEGSEQAPPARVGHGGSQEQGAGSEGGKSSRMAHGQGRAGRTFGGTRRPGSEDRARSRSDADVPVTQSAPAHTGVSGPSCPVARRTSSKFRNKKT